MDQAVFESQNSSPSKLFSQSNLSSDIPFIDRPMEEVDGGMYDDRGFYVTPNGSFWDMDGNYFNHDGKDKNGGSYDVFGFYNPGKENDDDKGIFVIKEEDFTNSSKIRLFELKSDNLIDNEVNNDFVDFLADGENNSEINEDDIDKDLQEYINEGIKMNENVNNINAINLDQI